MENSTPIEISQLLEDWNNGDEDAVERLFPYVYNELRSQAQFLMAGERYDHTLQPTALVHEAFIKVAKQSRVEWKNRTHFYRIVSRLMRQILVDHARRRNCPRRGNGPIRISIDDVQIPVEERIHSILAIDDLLEKLATEDERQSQIIEMRFFGGLSSEEIGEVLGVTKRTVGREWKLAKIWLLREVNGERNPVGPGS